PIIHAVRPGSPQVPPIHHSPPVPPGATNRVSPRTRPGSFLPGGGNAAFSPRTENTATTSEASTPNADENTKRLLTDATGSSSRTGKISAGASSASTSTSIASSLATVRPARSDSPPSPHLAPAPVVFEESLSTLATVRPDDSFPTPSLSLLPPPPPWNHDNNNNSMSSSVSSSQTGGGKGNSAVRQLFVCPYCRALPTMCRCSASLNSASETGNSASFDDSEDESESTYAFSTLDSDFIAWMRLSVKNVPASHPCYSSRQAEALAALTRQEVVNIVAIFNTNPLGLRMSLSEETSKLIGTIRVYINLIKPVKMSLRQTMRHMPQQAPDSPAAAVPDRLISFFLPRGGSRLLQLSGSTSAQEVIQCLLDRFHIQESANKFALYEHTLETQTILSRKLPPSERPLSMVMHWVRSAQASGEEFASAIRRKRIVLQENENWEVDWSDFTPAELMNFLRILEKEEAEYRNAIYYQYGLVRQQIEQRMAQLSAQDRLLAARHSVATCPPPPEQLICPSSSTSVANTSNKMEMHHASL
ncbi:unnamed protein product, partial [Rodentolepis nana]|uniref:Ras-associating domain-containing protein n=1 Tax=Rodentolepis nana TaxID=102285 RepID=A0A0R3T2T8_RODNA